MRVLFVNHTARLGGAERSLLDLLGAVRPRVQTALFVFEDGPLAAEAHKAGANVFVYPKQQRVTNFSRQEALRRPWGLIPLLPQSMDIVNSLAGFAREWRADLLHANSVKAPPFAIRAGRKTGLPVISHLRDIFPPRFPFTAHLRAMARYSHTVLTNSHAVAAQFAPGQGRIIVAQNGIDPAALQAQAAKGLIRPLGLEPGGLLLTLVGRLQYWKGQDTAIQALVQLPSQVKLALIGQGLDQEDAAPALRAQAASLGLTSRVLFLGERPDAAALMAEAAIVLHTSREPEPFGRVVLEAMMLGKPVIATDLGGPREMIEHRRHGLLIPPDNPQALAQAVAWIMEHPTEAAAMAQAGQQRALAEFTLDRLAAQIETVWQEAVCRAV